MRALHAFSEQSDLMRLTDNWYPCTSTKRPRLSQRRLCNTAARSRATHTHRQTYIGAPARDKSNLWRANPLNFRPSREERENEVYNRCLYRHTSAPPRFASRIHASARCSATPFARGSRFRGRSSCSTSIDRRRRPREFNPAGRESILSAELIIDGDRFVSAQAILFFSALVVCRFCGLQCVFIRPSDRVGLASGRLRFD